MVEELKHKCYFNIEGGFNPCRGMTLMLEYCEPKIRVEQLINFSTGKERDLGVVIPKTKKHQGLCLNFCPFCQEPTINGKDDLRTDKIPYYKKEGEKE